MIPTAALLVASRVATGVSREVPQDHFGVPPWLWVAFLAGVAGMLLVDLLVLHRNAHEVSIREAAVSSAVWISIGLAFSLVVWAVLDNGNVAAVRYLTGYVVEKSLSADNVFVWAVIFGHFVVPLRYQHRVLFWGVFGAIAMRAAFIFAGAALLARFDWMNFVFGAVLLVAAANVFTETEEDADLELNRSLRWVRRVVPVAAGYDGQRFFTRVNAKRVATPLLVVLIMIEVSDVVFAVDSVPAILSITSDRFVLFSSNVMAILGLRSLYFLLAAVRDRLRHLNRGLGGILAFVGVKMIVNRWYAIGAAVSLAVILGILAVSVVMSLRSTSDAA